MNQLHQKRCSFLLLITSIFLAGLFSFSAFAHTLNPYRTVTATDSSFQVTTIIPANTANSVPVYVTFLLDLSTDTFTKKDVWDSTTNGTGDMILRSQAIQQSMDTFFDRLQAQNHRSIFVSIYGYTNNHTVALTNGFEAIASISSAPDIASLSTYASNTVDLSKPLATVYQSFQSLANNASKSVVLFNGTPDTNNDNSQKYALALKAPNSITIHDAQGSTIGQGQEATIYTVSLGRSYTFNVDQWQNNWFTASYLSSNRWDQWSTNPTATLLLETKKFPAKANSSSELQMITLSLKPSDADYEKIDECNNFLTIRKAYASHSSLVSPLINGQTANHYQLLSLFGDGMIHVVANQASPSGIAYAKNRPSMLDIQADIISNISQQDFSLSGEEHHNQEVSNIPTDSSIVFYKDGRIVTPSSFTNDSTHGIFTWSFASYDPSAVYSFTYILSPTINFSSYAQNSTDNGKSFIRLNNDPIEYIPRSTFPIITTPTPTATTPTPSETVIPSPSPTSTITTSPSPSPTQIVTPIPSSSSLPTKTPTTPTKTPLLTPRPTNTPYQTATPAPIVTPSPTPSHKEGGSVMTKLTPTPTPKPLPTNNNNYIQPQGYVVTASPQQTPLPQTQYSLYEAFTEKPITTAKIKTSPEPLQVAETKLVKGQKIRIPVTQTALYTSSHANASVSLYLPEEYELVLSGATKNYYQIHYTTKANGKVRIGYISKNDTTLIDSESII